MGLLNKIFFKIGYLSASNPFTACFFAAMVTLICSLGFINYKLTNNPQDLWVPTASRANVEQTYFNEQFGAFFRINTFFIAPKNEENADDDLFQKPYLELMYHLQVRISDNLLSVKKFSYYTELCKSYINKGGIIMLPGFLEIHVAIETATFQFKDQNFQHDDFCFKPISGKGCIVTSPMQYWQTDLKKLQDDPDVKETSLCIPPPGAKERVCFDKIGVPVMQYTIFGKLKCQNEKESACSNCRVLASALQATFLLNNNEFQFETASEWEKQIYIGNIKTFNKLFEYSSELPDGVGYNMTLYNKLKEVKERYEEQKFKFIPIKVDYLAERSVPDNIELEGSQNAYIIVISYIMMFIYVSVSIGFFPSAVYNRFILGFAGISVVIFALIMAIGITFYAGVPLTMISAEVVPFLILAIGVDNMFLISRAERAIPEHVTQMELRVAYAMKEIGPSIFAAAFCEALAFFIGMLTDVPALYSFCLVAGLSVLCDFVLQITLFIAALTLDGKRIQNNRADILFCMKIEKHKKPRKEWIRTLFEKFYVPFLFYPLTQAVVFGIAICLFIISICSCIKLQPGLNQNVSLVEDSDTFNYFNTLFDYGAAGPPGYLVFKNIDYTIKDNLDHMAEMQVQLAQLNSSVISPVYSWVTPFQQFIKGGDWSTICGSDQAKVLDFDEQVRKFVAIKVNSPCCQQYGICGEQFVTDINFDDTGKVSATRFRFAHTPVRYQKDFIDDLVLTRRATDQFSEKLIPRQGKDLEVSFAQKHFENQGLFHKLTSMFGAGNKLETQETEAPNAFTYSLIYVFYDQYTYIRGVLAQNTLLGTAVIILALQILGELKIALIIGACVFLVLFELMGCMWMLNEVFGGYPIQMNAVFVVNLITSLGFGVEFCNHIGMNFMRQAGDKQTRAMRALAEMGSSVLVGIASTKFIGVVVLAFAPSTIFKLYYFRMYLFIILLGLFNGLCFLPLVLRWIGPQPDAIELKEHKKDLREFEKIRQMALIAAKKQ